MCTRSFGRRISTLVKPAPLPPVLKVGDVTVRAATHEPPVTHTAARRRELDFKHGRAGMGRQQRVAIEGLVPLQQVVEGGVHVAGSDDPVRRLLGDDGLAA